MINLNLFASASEQDAAYNGDAYIEPWVDYVRATGVVHYNKKYVVSADAVLKAKLVTYMDELGLLENPSDGITKEEAKSLKYIGNLFIDDQTITSFDECQYFTNLRITDYSTSSRGFFSGSSLKSIVLPEGLDYVYYRSFKDCTKLETITIPVSVKYINYYAFQGCTSLTDVYYGGTVSDWRTNMSNGQYYDGWSDMDTSNITVHCSDGDTTVFGA